MIFSEVGVRGTSGEGAQRSDALNYYYEPCVEDTYHGGFGYLMP